MIKSWFYRFFMWLGNLLTLRAQDQILSELRNPRAHRKTVWIVILAPSVPAIMSRKVVLVDGDEKRVNFDPVGPLPAGLLVHVIGDAAITDVTVGNMAQLLAWTTESPFCLTRDPCETGNRIRVGVKGL